MFTSLLRSSFVKNVSVLASGSAGSAVISILLTPIISRIFQPEHYGVAVFFASICGLTGSVATLQYQRASLLAKDERDVLLLLILPVRLLGVTALLAYTGFVIFHLAGLPLPFEETLGNWIWLFPAGTFLTGVCAVLSVALVRSKEFYTIAIASVGQASTMGLSRIAFGALFGSSVWGLITGYTISLVSQLALLRGKTHNALKLIKGRASLSSLRATAVEYRDFPIYSMPAGFVGMFSDKLPIFVFATMFAPEIAGFYAMANRLARAPIVMVSTSIRRVYMQRIAQISNHGGPIRQIHTKVTIGILLLGLVPFGILMIYGREIMVFILGENWTQAGLYVQILVPWYFATWVNSTTQPVLTVRRKQPLFLYMQIALLVGRVACFAAAYLLFISVETTLELFVTINVIAISLMIAVAFKLAFSDPPDETQKS